MRAPRLLLTLLLVTALVPGLVEVAENAWHQATEGHTAHAADRGGDHAPEGDEHGCSGTVHVCSCHHSVYSDLAVKPRLRVRDRWRGAVLPAAADYQEPVPPRLDHPPRA
ncbi:MAG TPA: hypothetical protein VKU40_05060 [Thermoanaerobaculia bacterium]|nr:hypothetical protein [Thermoanaerobaculia bacterium]